MKFFIFLFGREAPVLGWLDKFKGAPFLVPSFCIQYSAVSHHASKPFGIQHRHLELAFTISFWLLFLARFQSFCSGS
jgi:hypothetical protein